MGREPLGAMKTQRSTMPRVYLDHAATTPMAAAAIDAMVAAMRIVGNPSSVHAGGRSAFAIVEDARDTIARWAGVVADAVVFTSGGTEAIALAMRGSAGATRSSSMDRALASAVEHSAVLQSRDDIMTVAVDGDGVIDCHVLEAMLKQGAGIVAVQQVNNETGVIQPLADVAACVSAHGGLLMVDAVQAAGKMALAQADFVAISAHKLGGPPGVGALIVRDPGTLRAVQRGGGQERGLRGGTPNLPGIAGFAAAVLQTYNSGAVAGLRKQLEQRLLAVPGTVINGAGAPRAPHISSITLPGVPGGTQVMAMDMAGFMVSAGAACSSGKVAASHVLAAMGVPAGDAIRVSLGPDTAQGDIDAFVAAWLAMAARLGQGGLS